MLLLLFDGKRTAIQRKKVENSKGTVRTANDDDQERKMKGEELIDQVSTKKREEKRGNLISIFRCFSLNRAAAAAVHVTGT